MPRYARLRSDLVSVPSTIDNATVYTVKDPVTGTYFRLREPEHWLIHQLDGLRSPEQVAESFQHKYGFALGADQVTAFIGQLEKLFFLEDGRSEQELARAARRAGRTRSLASRILFIKIKAFNPARLLDYLAARYRPFHRPFWFILELVVILAGLAALAANAQHFAVRFSELFHVASIATIVISLFLLVSLHEFAHAVVCRHYGGQVREMGFLLMYFQPCLYSDVSDAWLLEKRSQRMAVTWAGLYFQLVFLAVALAFWKVTVSGYFLNELARTCVIVSWVTFLFNLNPLIKLDGYYLLSDWLDIPNLRSKAFAYLGNIFRRSLLGWPLEKITPTARERKIFLVYAVMAFAYSAFLILYFVVLLAGFLSARLGGSGILLLLLVMLLILRQSLVKLARGIIQHFVYMKNLLHHPIRLTVYLIILGVIVIGGFFVPIPNRVSGKVTAEPVAEFTVTLSVDGILGMTLRRGGESPERQSNILKISSNDVGAFELSPLVREGQQIKAGDTLAIVTSNQVSRDIVAQIAELQRLESNLTLLKAPKKKDEIAEAGAKVNAAQARYDQLLRDLKRTEALVDKNLAPAEKLESDRSAVAVAKAELADKKSALALLKSPPRPEEIAVLEHDIARQRAHVDYLNGQAKAQVVTTPIGGTVIFSQHPNSLLNVIDISSLELQVPVSDFDIKYVATGQNAQLKVHSYADVSYSGRVVRVPRFAVSSDQDPRFPVAVTIDNTDGSLKQGMSGYAKIDVGKTSVFGFLFRKLASMIYVELWSWF